MKIECLEHVPREWHAEILRRSADVIGAGTAEAPFGDDDRAKSVNPVEAVEPAAGPAFVLGRIGVPGVSDAAVFDGIARRSALAVSNRRS